MMQKFELVRVDVPLLMAQDQHWLALGACADNKFQVFIREGGWPTLQLQLQHTLNGLE